jgi:6-phosphogluconolactonase
MTHHQIKIFRDIDEIADYVYYLMSNTVFHDDFHMALSGGNTPKAVYTRLATSSPSKIAWDKIKIYWGDERCVAPDDPESNYFMAKESLLEKINIPERNIFRIMGENDPDLEKERYGELILSNHAGVFDLIFLGLGSDGHIASIFSDQMHLLDSKHVCEKAQHPESKQFRVTLTGRIINASKNIIFIVTGLDKSEVVSDIFNQTGKWRNYPATYINPKKGKMLWLLDEQAAARLDA